MKTYDLVGLGIGVFNLSLAALMEKTSLAACFLDKKPEFSWHSELIFNDSTMQTSYLKDLVTPVDPTNPHSFLNYLVQKGLIYSFLNTNRSSVTRKEFEGYCKWVSENIHDKLQFQHDILSVNFDKDLFKIETSQGSYYAKNICIGTGLTPHLPEFAQHLVSSTLFHAKSPEIGQQNFSGKKVVIIGGGQTGVEIFRNALNGHWGAPQSLQLISGRPNLEPLDNSPFVNEYFTPNYVNEFLSLEQEAKDPIVGYQKLASDGNTPEYLELLYNDLYQTKYVDNDPRTLELLPYRRVENIVKTNNAGYIVHIRNGFAKAMESLEADIVVLCTGFKTNLPRCIEPLLPQIKTDSLGRLSINNHFEVDWANSSTNKIFAVNFSRHGHGISEPQTSLMAWRSATIINALSGSEVYKTLNPRPNFVTYLRK